MRGGFFISNLKVTYRNYNNLVFYTLSWYNLLKLISEVTALTTGEKIAKCRKEYGLTQTQLAEELGVTRQAVSRWESDLAFPETENLLKMSKLFGVSTDWILKYDNSESYENAEIQTGKSSFKFDIKKFYFEYKSKTHIGNLPLVHVNLGIGRTAKGVFAFGLTAIGIVSFGLLSLGVVSFGILCLGLISFASVSGGVLAFGGVAIGCICFGGVSIGLYSVGGCSIGLFAVGGYANAYYVAIGDVAVGQIAVGKTSATGSLMSVLKPQYNEMKSELYQKLDELPKFWLGFTDLSKKFIEQFIFYSN